MIRILACLFLFAPLYGQIKNSSNLNDLRSEVYRTVDEHEMKLWIVGDKVEGQTKPAILFFFGGGWNSGSPTQFAPQAKHLAKRGMIAILVDYRVKSRQGVQAVECVKDGKAALAWVRKNAERLGVHPQRIATAGGSAGGHIAAAIGTLDGLGSTERPNAMILFNPATTLASIGEWKAKRELPKERTGVEKSENLSPAHHIGKHTPTTLIMHGTNDTTVPIGTVEAFEAEMKKHTRPCKLVRYEGAGHGFFNRGKHLEETTQEMDAFLVSLGWISKS